MGPRIPALKYKAYIGVYTVDEHKIISWVLSKTLFFIWVICTFSYLHKFWKCFLNLVYYICLVHQTKWTNKKKSQNLTLWVDSTSLASRHTLPFLFFSYSLLAQEWSTHPLAILDSLIFIYFLYKERNMYPKYISTERHIKSLIITIIMLPQCYVYYDKVHT